MLLFPFFFFGRKDLSFTVSISFVTRSCEFLCSSRRYSDRIDPQMYYSTHYVEMDSELHSGE